MTVYVLHLYWDTPDNEGNGILGVYHNFEDAQRDMNIDAASIKEQYPDDFWVSDMTWTDENEIHLGYDPMDCTPATVYCWKIDEMEVR